MEPLDCESLGSCCGSLMFFELLLFLDELKLMLILSFRQTDFRSPKKISIFIAHNIFE